MKRELMRSVGIQFVSMLYEKKKFVTRNYTAFPHTVENAAIDGALFVHAKS